MGTLMPITADTATVTSFPGLLHTVLASNPPSTEPVDTPTDTARGVLTLMLMLTTADTAMVDMADTVLASLTTDTAPLPTSTGLPRDSMATMDMVDTATSARGVLRLMLMLTTAMVDMVDTAMDMVDTVMVMEDTVMDMDMATVVDTVMDMAMVTTDKLRGQIMFVQYCAIAILF